MIKVVKKVNNNIKPNVKNSMNNVSSTLFYFKENDSNIYTLLVSTFRELNDLFLHFYSNKIDKEKLVEITNSKVSQIEILVSYKSTVEVEKIKYLNKSINSLVHIVTNSSKDSIKNIRGYITEGVCLSYYADSRNEYVDNEIINNTFVWDAEFFDDKYYYEIEFEGKIARSVDIYSYCNEISLVECKTRPTNILSDNKQQLLFLDMMKDKFTDMVKDVNVNTFLFLLDGYNHLEEDLQEYCSIKGIKILTSQSICNY